MFDFFSTEKLSQPKSDISFIVLQILLPMLKIFTF